MSHFAIYSGGGGVCVCVGGGLHTPFMNLVVSHSCQLLYAMFSRSGAGGLSRESLFKTMGELRQQGYTRTL